MTPVESREQPRSGNDGENRKEIFSSRVGFSMQTKPCDNMIMNGAALKFWRMEGNYSTLMDTQIFFVQQKAIKSRKGAERGEDTNVAGLNHELELVWKHI
jgi:hypothetical protein